MKNTVDEIIQAFSKEEFREFKYFLSRRKSHTHDREDLRVIEAIRKKVPELPRNVTAFRNTKNRLKTQLEHFIELENIKHNTLSRIQNLVEVAGYLFGKNLYDHAWDYLIKAEKMATQAEEYELLNYIYYIQILYAHNIAVPPPASFSVPVLLKKRNNNLSFARTDGNANAAYALLIHEMRELFSRQLSADIDQMVNKILTDYDLTEVMYDQIRIYCKIVIIVSRGLREKRDYHRMKTYTINSYKLIEKKKMLDKVPPGFLMDVLDAIGVACLRSRDYKNTEKYQGVFTSYAKKFSQQADEFSYYDFIPYIGDADLFLCTNRLQEAKATLMKVQEKYGKYTGSIRIYFLLRINLLAVLFASNDHKTCIRIYHEIMSQNEKKILNERGFRLELMLYTELYGVLFYCEHDDADHALHLLGRIKRKYAALLKKHESERELMFMRILEEILHDPSCVRTKSFLASYDAFISMKEFIPGDYEYISLNAWLSAKVSEKKYYDCFLQLVK